MSVPLRHARALLPLIACLGSLLAGCVSPSPYGDLPRTGDPLTDGQLYIEQGPPRDRVLWQYRTALTALRAGDRDLAKSLLDEGLATLGGILGDEPSARRARKLFHEEAEKKFIGEPYERSMAYFYRGILYWMDGEPDNARACFRNAQFQDADIEDKGFSSDWVLLDYLDGLISSRLAGDGTDALKRAREAADRQTGVDGVRENPPDYSRSNNVFLLVEMGQGPSKVAAGQHGEQLKFKPGQSEARGVKVTAGAREVRARPYDSLTYQATTRGGRVMDHILGRKAVFKDATGTLGDAAVVTGAILAQNRNTRNEGLAVLAAGLLSHVISAQTTPAADTRTWNNLPQYLTFAALDLPPGQQSLTVEFLDAGGRPIPSIRREFQLDIPSAARDTIVFVSSQN